MQVSAPSIRGNTQVVFGNLNWYTGVQGVTADYFEARDWMVVSGRPIGPEDVDGATKVALLGQTTAQNLFGEADPIGQIIRIKKVPFTVIGLLDRKGQNSWGQDQDDVLLHADVDRQEEGARQEQLQSARRAGHLGEDPGRRGHGRCRAAAARAPAPAPPPAAVSGRRLQRA